ncbi:hypothetical protein GLOIN_2v1784178 [Rhizophagus clarus]|uniref:Uncharacterized protein n=1 Tax=Rhizophagus clarus TaxID=94130 RepID=A0A8H3R462_9GLOM|nr:hypothetical protein GLOIN_2v1784178 [Rhizophagus clarus]
MAIIGHHSVGGYHTYAKPNNSHKREALFGIINRLNGLPLLPSLNTTSKRKNSINESDFSQSTSISESDSDFDVDESQEDSISNVSSFCTAKEIMEKDSCINSASHAPEEDHIIMKKKKDYKYKKVMIVKKYYKNCTFNK